jgi:hypothetical protein
MHGIRGEPVEVWLRHDRPARFVWRGRMYTVLFVLDKRTLAGPGEQNCECWQVEATPVRAVPATTFELCYDAAAKRWSLSR